MYYPNLKTSDAELRAVRFLDADTKRKINPIFELTRSRKTLLSPNGSLRRRMDQLVEAYGGGNFILDLSTEEDLMNDETISMFDETDGYANWRNFIIEFKNLNIIPCAMFVDDGNKENFNLQVKYIVDNFGSVCIRTSVLDENAPQLYRWALEATSSQNILCCGITYFVDKKRAKNSEISCQEYLKNVVGNRPPKAILFPGSSFPRYVTEMDGCKDLEGEFQANELLLERELMQQFPNLPIKSSDFASVHPIRYQTSGGNWIPRIDIFDGMSFHYVRARRNDGGYGSAAQTLNRSLVSKLPDCWGKRQIESAMKGMITGGKPSFWFWVGFSWLPPVGSLLPNHQIRRIGRNNDRSWHRTDLKFGACHPFGRPHLEPAALALVVA
ncbi:MAG: hypothetical protein QM744_15055 [Mesorhizobium sp.]